MLAIGFDDPVFKDQAEALSIQLQLSINPNAPLCLWISESGLGLKKIGFLPVSADFNYQTWEKRRQAGKKQGLIKACHPVIGANIIDATAGWGRDAAILALSGAKVCMIERNPIMAMILEDALNRQDPISQQKMKLSLIHMNAYDYLQSLQPENYPDMIYLDPMHPERQKSALVKKDLQLLQAFIGNDADALSVLQVAIEKVKHKVIVKWPQSQKGLLTANYCIPGKTVRFDLYTSMLNIKNNM